MIRTSADRHRLAQEQAALVARALLESAPAERARGPVGRHTPGDARQLRGIPVVGVVGGVGGAISGTKPGMGRRLDGWRGR